jgi:hypothetical protein
VARPPQKLEGSGPDQYAYITVTTNFTEDKWVVAAELRAGNRKVVHHAHVFVVDDARKTAVEAKGKDPAAEYGKWLLVKEGTLEYMRPGAPVIDDGCAVDDNGEFPGIKQNDLETLLSSYLPGREPTCIRRAPPGWYRREPSSASRSIIRTPRARRKRTPTASD